MQGPTLGVLFTEVSVKRESTIVLDGHLVLVPKVSMLLSILERADYNR